MLAADRERTLDVFARQAIVHIERNPTHELARVAYDVFDTNDDGVITVAEMADSAIAQALFAPDLDTDGDGDDDGLSFGLGFTCERAQFTAPGEV
jgi:Ca2+-binding EF-hand superfamily protein